MYVVEPSTNQWPLFSHITQNSTNSFIVSFAAGTNVDGIDVIALVNYFYNNLTSQVDVYHNLTGPNTIYFQESGWGDHISLNDNYMLISNPAKGQVQVFWMDASFPFFSHLLTLNGSDYNSMGGFGSNVLVKQGFLVIADKNSTFFFSYSPINKNTTSQEISINHVFTLPISSSSMDIAVWSSSIYLIVGASSKQLAFVYQVEPKEYTWKTAAFGSKLSIEALASSVAIDSSGVIAYTSPTYQNGTLFFSYACPLNYQFLKNSFQSCCVICPSNGTSQGIQSVCDVEWTVGHIILLVFAGFVLASLVIVVIVVARRNKPSLEEASFLVQN